jgi:hypothetical protein
MLRAIAAILAFGLIASNAWAQTRPAPGAISSSEAAELAAQASLSTSYLLALYMEQLAAAGTPPTQADIDAAAHAYFTNGAAATGVPATGPGAAYFHDGAGVTAAPSSGPGAQWFHQGASALAYPAPATVPPSPSPSPPSAAQASVPADAGLDAGEDGRGEEADAGQDASISPASTPPLPSETAAMPHVPATPTVAASTSSLTCSPEELETALAIGKKYALAAAPAGSAHPGGDAGAAPAPASSAGGGSASPTCTAGPPAWIRIGTLVVGGALAVVGAIAWLRASALHNRSCARLQGG